MSEKTQTTPPAPSTKERLTKKTSKWLTILFAIWLLWLLVPSAKEALADGGSAASRVISSVKSWSEKKAKPPQEAAPVMPTITLGCANTDNPYSDLRDVKEQVLVIPPLGSCTTDSQIRPWNSTKFLYRPLDGELLVQEEYDGGTRSEFKLKTPSTYEPTWTNRINSLRFQNPSQKTVRVWIDLH